MKTAVFRGGCLTGPAHAGTELHGFLAYLMKCTVTGKPYRVFGYRGKQVRDNIHSHDLVSALGVFQSPRPGEVYASAAAARPIVPCWKPLSCAKPSPGKIFPGLTSRKIAAVTTAGGSVTWPNSKSTTRRGVINTICVARWKKFAPPASEPCRDQPVLSDVMDEKQMNRLAT